MKKMLLFDIDGTLLLTGGAGCIAFNRAFEELFGTPHAYGNTFPHGKTDPIIIREIAQRVLRRSLRPSEYRLLCRRYTVHFHEALKEAPRFRLMPGIPNLLGSIRKAKRVIAGIQTGNFRQTARLKLQKGRLSGYFSFGGFGSDSTRRKEILRTAIRRGKRLLKIRRLPPCNIFVIGDAPQDIQAAKGLNLKSIAVATGHHTEKELKIHRPDYLLPDLSNSRRFLEIILSDE